MKKLKLSKLFSVFLTLLLIYTSNYAYTNMEVISFVPSVAGTYNVHVEFANTGTVFNDNTRFGFSANLVA